MVEYIKSRNEHHLHVNFLPSGVCNFMRASLAETCSHACRRNESVDSLRTATMASILSEWPIAFESDSYISSNDPQLGPAVYMALLCGAGGRREAGGWEDRNMQRYSGIYGADV